MEDLRQLAEKYGTDKRAEDHNYVMMYECLMSSNRYKTKKLLEVGYGEGSSIKMWKDYFINAEIYCMEYFDEEYRDKWNSPSVDIPGVTIFSGDSTKIESWSEVPYDLDYIIDDGSHLPKDQVNTFLNGFSHLASHGLYFIEDTHCGFDKPVIETNEVYRWFFYHIIRQQTPGVSWGGNFYQCLYSGGMDGMEQFIYSYQFYKSVIVLERA